MTEPKRAPLIYLITDRRGAGSSRPLPATIEQALRALLGAGAKLPPGAVAVQLREKDLGGRALVELAREVRRVTAAAGVRLFVNDRVDVALAVGADGVHLGGGALTVDDTHAVAPDLEVALSTHSPAEVARASADPRVGFVVFGPVFDTPSKRVHGPPLGLEKLREACAFPVPVLALGGVQADRILECFISGASGVASMGGVLRNSAPEVALKAFFGAIEST